VCPCEEEDDDIDRTQESDASDRAQASNAPTDNAPTDNAERFVADNAPQSAAEAVDISEYEE
jgi:hypothetical protein